MVDLPPDAKVGRDGFAQLGATTKTHLLFVAEVAPAPGQVAAEMLEERTRSKSRD
jgi:hypothetical protein